MSEGGRPHVGLWGAAGGLGAMLAESLLEAGCRVTGVDGLLPACAPEPVYYHRLQTLQQAESFEFIPLDIRHPSASEIVAVKQPDLWLVAAYPAPLLYLEDVTPFYHKQVESFHRALSSLLKRSVAPWLIFQHDPACGLSDFESNQQAELRNATPENDRFRFLNLPLLWGPGQAPHSFPLHQIRRIIADLPIQDTFPENVQLADIRKVTEQVTGLVLEGIPDLTQFALQPPLETVKPEALLARARHLLTQSPTSDAEEPDDSLSETTRAILDDLLVWRSQCPWEPPLNWPRKRRVKRKRKKKKKQDR